MRKALVALMAVACILLGGYYYKLRQQEDNVAPVISFPNVDAIYVEGTDTSVLLDGVTAVDDVDGDVSDTLVVDSVIPMQNQHQATVLYYAKDKSNNVQKTDRIVEYRPSGRDRGADGRDRCTRRPSEDHADDRCRHDP
jgi:hypothetical protein